MTGCCLELSLTVTYSLSLTFFLFYYILSSLLCELLHEFLMSGIIIKRDF